VLGSVICGHHRRQDYKVPRDRRRGQPLVHRYLRQPATKSGGGAPSAADGDRGPRGTVAPAVRALGLVRGSSAAGMASAG
jgi:hypothetical protein